MYRVGTQYHRAISIHVPREGDDPSPPCCTAGEPQFQSTSPVRGTTTGRCASIVLYKFQSTSPVRGTTGFNASFNQPVYISIHVPREGDDRARVAQGVIAGISIHVPREGDDGQAHPVFCLAANFNPRPP